MELSLSALKDWHGRYLGIDISKGHLVSGNGIISTRMVRHNDRPDLAFLLALENIQSFSCASYNAPASPILSFRVVQMDDSKIALRHPLEERYLSSEPRELQQLICDRKSVAGWEQFTVELTPQDEPLPCWAQAINDVVGNGMNACALRRWCLRADNQTLTGAFGAFLCLLTRDEMERFGAFLLEDADLLERLRCTVSDDYWISSVFPKLASWCREREPLSHTRLDGSTDFLGQIDYGVERAPPAGLILLGQTRRLIEPRKRACVLATARNEGIYLLEWVAWHRMIGFDHIFLCSNNNTDGSNELLGTLARHGIITWIDTNPESPTRIQAKSYSAALACTPQMLDYRWTLVADLDEFLALDWKHYRHIGPFFDLQEARGADAIAFSWVMMTPDSQLQHRDIPMVSRFQRREPPENVLVKTAFQTRLAPFSHAHHPQWAYQHSFRTFDTRGKLLHTEQSGHQAIGQLSEKNAWIGHYFHKSLEEYVWKCSRPRGGTTSPQTATQMEARFLEPFIDFFGTEKTLPDARLTPFFPALEAEINHLRSFPDIREADQNIRLGFRQKIGGLVSQFSQDIENSHRPTPLKSKWEELYAQYNEMASH